jgi:hypothetical protein
VSEQASWQDARAGKYPDEGKREITNTEATSIADRAASVSERPPGRLRPRAFR